MSERNYLQQEVPKDMTNFTPRILNVDGDNFWVDNVISLGDLIEQKMGTDVSGLFFEVIASLADGVMFGGEDDEYE